MTSSGERPGAPTSTDDSPDAAAPNPPGLSLGRRLWRWTMGTALAFGAFVALTVWQSQARVDLTDIAPREAVGVVTESQDDSIRTQRDGRCIWERRLRIVNRGKHAVKEVASHFPHASYLPFTATNANDLPLATRGSSEKAGVRVAIKVDPPLAAGETLRLVLRSTVQGLIRRLDPESDTARLALPLNRLAREADRVQLWLVTPTPGLQRELEPAALVWDSRTRAQASTALIWQNLKPQVPDTEVGVLMPAALFDGPLATELPFAPTRLLWMARALLVLALLLASVVLLGSPRWHEPCLAVAMLLQYLVFAQPMLLEDNLAYHSYVRSLRFDGDLDMANEYKLFNSYSIYAPNPLEPPGPTGASVMLAPFFLLGDAFRGLLERGGWPHPANGFSWPYVASMNLGGLVYAFGTLILAYRFAKEFAGPRVALAATLAASVGTNLFMVSWFWTSSTHAPSCFLVTAFLYVWWRTREDRTPALWALLGLLGGLATQTRYQNGVFLALPFIDLLTRPRQHFGGGRWRALPAGLVGFAFFAALGVSFQLITWWGAEGAPVVDNYGVGKDRFGETLARLPKLLFGRHGFGGTDGIWISMPILAISWIWLVLTFPWLSGTERWLVLALVGQIAVVSSYETYWGKLLYGSAYLLNCTAVTVLGLARFLSFCRRRGVARFWLTAFLLATIGWHLHLEIKQQAFEQVAFTGDTSAAWKLRQLWFLPATIVPGYYRMDSGNFGHGLRELLTPGGEMEPVLALTGVGALLMLVIARWSRQRTVAGSLLLLSGCYLGTMGMAGFLACERGRTATWSKVQDSVRESVVRFRLAGKAGGRAEIEVEDPGPYRQLTVVTHLLGGAAILDGTPVAEVHVRTVSGRETPKMILRAGIDTASIDALRPGAEKERQHRVPWDRIVHQWRTRDGSPHYYSGCAYAATLEFPGLLDVKEVIVDPLVANGIVAVTDLVLTGDRKSRVRQTEATPTSVERTGSHGLDDSAPLSPTAPAVRKRETPAPATPVTTSPAPSGGSTVPASTAASPRVTSAPAVTPGTATAPTATTATTATTTTVSVPVTSAVSTPVPSETPSAPAAAPVTSAPARPGG